MSRPFIANAIGKPTDATVIRGRENVPTGDDFAWWSCHYEYRHGKTGETYRLEDLQNKYHMGFGQAELWQIIDREYESEEVYVMSVNHPRRTDNDHILFEDEGENYGS